MKGAALVTGSAKGIGKAMSLKLAKLGYDVAIHYRSSQEEAEAVAAEARACGVKAITLQADVTKQTEAEELVTAAHEQLGSLNVLVNNVGNYFKGTLEETDANTWHEMFASNLHSSFYTCQRAVSLMRAAGGGRIINIGYAGAEQMIARPVVTAYATAKTGVILYSKALAKSEADNGITVNVISPGVMENSVTKPLSEIPIGRVGKLTELTAALEYLVSEEAAYITGVTLEVAGAWNS